MRTVFFVIVISVCFLFGFFFFAFYNGLIILRYPSYRAEVEQFIENMKVDKKKVFLFYRNKKKWNKEKVYLLWTNDKAKNIEYLINSWLTLLDEERVMKKRVSLQTVLLASSLQKAYLSFDRNPFSSDSPTHEKWMWVEGLLKTLRENDIDLQTVYFLVHHQIMDDYHLDFSNPWPICGFLGL